MNIFLHVLFMTVHVHTRHYRTAGKSAEALQVHSETDTNLELKTYQRYTTGEEEEDKVTQCRESVICGMWQISSLSEMSFYLNRHVK